MKREKQVSCALFRFENHNLRSHGIFYRNLLQLRLLELKKEQTEAELLKTEKETLKDRVEAEEKLALEAHREYEDEQRRVHEEAERVKNEEKARKTFKEMDINGDGL